MSCKFNSDRRRTVRSLAILVGVMPCVRVHAVGDSVVSGCNGSSSISEEPAGPKGVPGQTLGAIVEICGAVALPPNFRIQVIENKDVIAYAKIANAERYIIYNSNLQRELSDNSIGKWGSLSILAHEVGHHLCGHSLDSNGSRPTRELEADHFAGFILGALGATEGEAMAAYSGYPLAGGSTHPPRSERSFAVTAGWKKATGRIKANVERLNLVTHNKQPDGSYARVVVEFVNTGGVWIEYQHGKKFAAFEEKLRKDHSIFLFDRNRIPTMWLRIETMGRGQFAEGSWNRGGPNDLPVSWIPLDPIRWR